MSRLGEASRLGKEMDALITQLHVLSKRVEKMGGEDAGNTEYFLAAARGNLAESRRYVRRTLSREKAALNKV